MLLACLKGKHESTAPGSVGSLPYYASGELSHPLVAASHKAYVRTSVTQRNAKALTVADSYICAPLGRQRGLILSPPGLLTELAHTARLHQEPVSGKSLARDKTGQVQK